MRAPGFLRGAGIASAAFGLLAGFPQAAHGIDAKLKTPWTDVASSSSMPWSEYPRPQMVRKDWVSLNGEWDYMGGDSLANPADAPSDPPSFHDAEKIKVPYPPESFLSGIMRDMEVNMWYRRDFDVPKKWTHRGNKVLMHFEAIAVESAVYVNGELAGTHVGRWDSFSLDVTEHLQSGSNTVIVGAHDPHDGATSCGKGVVDLGDYTFTSGIWQTVWLEPVPESNIRQLSILPNVDDSSVSVKTETDGPEKKVKVSITAGKSRRRIKAKVGACGEDITLSVGKPHLWSPDDPFLYDLRVQLLDHAGKVVDEVTSYFGMRSIELGDAEDGKLHPIFNGRFLFQSGPLDQGYWPDGIHLAPTDEALKSDLDALKELGFNMVRKHAKVEPKRFYYWADKLGLLVWQDMPSLWWPDNSTAIRTQFEHEWEIIIQQHYNSPAIITWVPFNENWGAYDVPRITDWTKSLDPSRLVSGNSGYNNNPPYRPPQGDPGNGDYDDLHIYVGPGDPPQPSDTRAGALGEYGGVGLLSAGHMWPGVDHNAYEMQNSTAELTTRFEQTQRDLHRLISDKGLGVAIYTQTTDVEHEVNGFLTYDRRVRKMDFGRAKKAIETAIGISG